MLSKKSFFNKTLFMKTVCRFWPLWVLYCAVWMVALPFVLGAELRYDYGDVHYVARHIYELTVYGGTIIGFIAAAASAMAVWSFMYNGRSAHGMAMLPVKREGVFASVTLAGIMPYVVANGLVFLATLGTMAAYGGVELKALFSWFAITTLMLVFFYGFAVFCAQLTGNIIVMPLVYAVLNFTAVVVEGITRTLLSTFIFGLHNNCEFITAFLSPVVEFFQNLRMVSDHDVLGDVLGYHFEGWTIVIVYALIGIAFVAAAMMLYRNRRVESAGDVVAVNVLKPVFKYCLTLGCALVLGWVFYMLSGIDNRMLPNLANMMPLIGFMIMGAFVGYFTAQMLIKKSFRVWKKGWGGFGLSVLVIIVIMVGMECDLFGYESYIPTADKVESVMITGGGNADTLSETENIELVREAHAGIVSHKERYERMNYEKNYVYSVENNTWRSKTFYFSYLMKDGSTVSRRYKVWFDQNDISTADDLLAIEKASNCTEAFASRYEGYKVGDDGEVVSVTIPANLPAAECAKNLGYNSIEEFLLCYYGGYPIKDIPFIGEQEKWQMIVDIAMGHAINVDDTKYSDEYYKYVETSFSADAAAAPYEIELNTPQYYAWFKENLVLENLWFQIDSTLTPAEAHDLYINCVLPDLQDGRMGRIWYYEGDEYEKSVYDTYINVEIRYPDRNSVIEGDYLYKHHNLRPSVDSTRTAAWLKAHGHELHTVAERMQYSATGQQTYSFSGYYD